MNTSKQFVLSAFVALAGFLPSSQGAVILSSADGFAVLGGSTVTSTGNTVLNGDLGVAPGLAITGFGPGVVNGTIYAGGAVAAQAQADAFTAYSLLAGEAPVQHLTGQDLGGLTLGPGVRDFTTSAQLTGILTLDAQGDPNARFDFQIGSTLTTASSSSIRLVNGAQADNVFWQVGSSAALGTGTAFLGTILANQSITLNSGASMFGRALALNGAVSLDNNTITAVPELTSFWQLLLAASVFGGLQMVTVWRRKTGHK
ncbi:MAG: ice-binding family protein [Verrucomicrobiota bacterium]